MPIKRHGNDAEEMCKRTENKGAKEKKAESEWEKERKKVWERNKIQGFYFYLVFTWSNLGFKCSGRYFVF